MIFVKSQIVTSPDSNFYTGQEGGRRKPPYAFTEQGIYMLATVLKGEVADQQSIFIMRAFREMRHFIANNALLFEKISHIELKQLEYQKSTDERFDKVFQYIEDHAESEQKIFFDGQIYDAFSLITSIIQKTQVFHDRFIILDGKTAYHVGASIKDAGKKCFGISLLEDPGMVTDLLNRLSTV